MKTEDEYTVIPVIPMEDPLLHTYPDHLFCDDPTCPCHEDQDNIGFIAGQVQDGLLTPNEATNIVNGKTV